VAIAGNRAKLMPADEKRAHQLTGPHKLGPYPDRHLDCQENLETSFLTLVNKAEAAGWVRIEIYSALIELIENHAIADHTLEGDTYALQRAKRNRR
jgi:hypothetical protein